MEDNPYKELKDSLLVEYERLLEMIVPIIEAAKGIKDDEENKRLINSMYSNLSHIRIFCQQAAFRAGTLANRIIPEYVAEQMRLADTDTPLEPV